MKTVYPFGYVTNLLYICGKIKEETGQGTGRCPAEDTEVRKWTVLGKQKLPKMTSNYKKKNYISTDDKDGGPQADEVRKQVLITDERLLINDCPWFAYLTLLRHLFAVKIKIFRMKLYIYEIKKCYLCTRICDMKSYR